MDLYFIESGDLTLNGQGDLAVTPTLNRDYAQFAYIRAMTDIGDFTLYPSLGANLSSLKGMPQSPATGQIGINLLRSALTREGLFANSTINIKAVPTAPDAIRFDIYIDPHTNEKISVTQEL